jgi:hypothetical protein
MMVTFGYLVEVALTMVIHNSNLQIEKLISDFSFFNDLWQFNGQEWTWVSGANQPNQEGVYGEKGVPDSNNVPGGREGALSWMDNSGNIWIFGGYGYPANNSSTGNTIHLSYKTQ